MAESRKMKTEKGLALVPGANPLADGCNFAVEVPEDSRASLILYKKRSAKPYVEIPFTEENRTGNVYAMYIPDFDLKEYEYNFLINGKVYTDPCAYRILGRERFGAEVGTNPHKVRGGFLKKEVFDWENDKNPAIPYHEMILYKLHVRGYTKANRTITGTKGTFQALEEMIPYWKELGINTIELMPAYEFMESGTCKNSESEKMVSEKHTQGRVNFWGYMYGYYFAPKRSYCATDDPEKEFKIFIKKLHQAGIACIMEMYFPRECNPVTALRALQFWKLYYHVDGFHVLGEGVSAKLLMHDGVLSDTRLMFHDFDESQIRKKKKPEDKCIAQYNPGFLQDMRRFLKSDEDMVSAAAYHIRRNPNTYAVINYMACQDGFTMNDMVTYNYRHNEANQENNHDGSSYNYSWNCGVEGPSRRLQIRQMRERQIRNAFLMVLLSQGVPMIYGGDEFGNSQNGNNNAYCQDNQVGWIDWKALKKNESLFQFVKNAIAFRKEHPILHVPGEMYGVDYQTRGLPDVSLHGERAWYMNSENTSRLLGIMYCGAYAHRADGSEDASIYVAYNFHWEDRIFALPNLAGYRKWKKVIDTSAVKENGFLEQEQETYSKKLKVTPRTIVVLMAVEEEKKDASVAALKTITRHKLLVMHYCFRAGMYKQGLLHDLSKYAPVEFLVGCKYYQGDRSPNNAEREDTGISKSWLHHKGRNKHHFEYWVDYAPGDEHIINGVPMPRKYIAEMVMDRISASRNYLGDKYDQHQPLDYYLKGKEKLWFIHPKTKRDLEGLLRILNDHGEEVLISYIKNVYLKKDKALERV